MDHSCPAPLQIGRRTVMRRPFSTLYVPPYFTLTNIFFPELRYQENKKATPSDTLSVSLKISRLVWLYGAGSRTRTDTMLPPTDFESVTSTNSIIPADWLTNIIHDGGGIGKPFHAEILLGISRRDFTGDVGRCVPRFVHGVSSFPVRRRGAGHPLV